MTRRLQFAGRLVGDGAPCLIVAEAGQNHNASPDIALSLVREAARAGADAVKFQTIQPEELYAPTHPRYAACGSNQLSRAVYGNLFRTASEVGVLCFSTPFDERSADLLEELGAPGFKVGSGELTHLALLRHLGRKGKPLFVSTGMADLEQIDVAVKAILDTGNDKIVVMHCVSMYPTPAAKANIRAIPRLRERFGVLVGFSDHTLGHAPALAAVALGACVVEKHFTLSRALPGADHSMSVEPHELGALVSGIREVEAALGTGERTVLQEEQELAAFARRGLYARGPIRKGQQITREDVAVWRPGGEIAAHEIDRVIGRRAAVDIAAAEPLRWHAFSD